MRLSRRHLLGAALAGPVVVLAERALRAAGSAAERAAATLRPPAAGTSASRCAQCGAVGHTMLSPDCPLAPRVR